MYHPLYHPKLLRWNELQGRSGLNNLVVTCCKHACSLLQLASRGEPEVAFKPLSGGVCPRSVGVFLF